LTSCGGDQRQTKLTLRAFTMYECMHSG
jgi:hypothetical protein